MFLRPNATDVEQRLRATRAEEFVSGAGGSTAKVRSALSTLRPALTVTRRRVLALVSPACYRAVEVSRAGDGCVATSRMDFRMRSRGQKLGVAANTSNSEMKRTSLLKIGRATTCICGAFTKRTCVGGHLMTMTLSKQKMAHLRGIDNCSWRTWYLRGDPPRT